MQEKKARECGVLAPDNSNLVKGIPTQSCDVRGNIRNSTDALLEYVYIGGFRIEDPDLTVSLYQGRVDEVTAFSDGVLAVDLFMDCRMVFDFPGKQLALQYLTPEGVRDPFYGS